jgi:hypothetical protein
MKNNTDDLRRIAGWVCDRAGRHDAVDLLTLYRGDGKAASVELSPVCAHRPRQSAARGDVAEAVVMAKATSTVCQWCDGPFRARRGGSPQRFCGAGCRTAFWSALRRWGERAVAAGILTINDIKKADPAACTLLPGRGSPAPVGEMPPQHSGRGALSESR